jgi:hypothetical protein
MRRLPTYGLHSLLVYLPFRSRPNAVLRPPFFKEELYGGAWSWLFQGTTMERMFVHNLDSDWNGWPVVVILNTAPFLLGRGLISQHETDFSHEDLLGEGFLQYIQIRFNNTLIANVVLGVTGNEEHSHIRLHRRQ